MSTAKDLSRLMVGRAARIYRLNSDAAKALDISATTFNEYCRQLGIETPSARRCRLKAQLRG